MLGSSCHQCGAELPVGSSEGLCPSCLLRAQSPPVAQAFGRYEILRQLGRGGMGVVYLARDISLNRKVALKFLSEKAAASTVAKKRLLREAKAAAALDHPYICKVYDTGEVEEQQFIAMEYVEGQTVCDQLENGPLPLRECLQIAVEIGEALEEAHDHHIIHRDLKPSNIMLTRGGHVKVMDFGLARQLDTLDEAQGEDVGWTKLTGSGSIVGTLAYMSPEQLRGEPADNRSDIFSFGLILYEMLTGVHPFGKDRRVEAGCAILNDRPRPLQHHLKTQQPLLDYVIGKMLNRSKAERHQSMHAVVTDLRRLQESIPTQAAGQRHWLVGAVAAAVLAVALVAGLLLSERSEGPLNLGQPVHRQVTFRGNVTNAALSPDGKMIAYTEETQDYRRLLVRDIESDKAIEIVAKQFEVWGDIVNLRWSPDGSRLLFCSADLGLVPQVHVVSRLGGPARQLAWGALAAWAPDGRSIAFAFADTIGFSILDLESGQVQKVELSGFLFLWGLDWSPATNLILIQAYDDSGGSLLLSVKPDGTGLSTSYKTPLEILASCWSADGKSIYALESDGLTADLVKIPITGREPGKPSVLLTGLQTNSYLDLSENGSSLLYGRTFEFANLWRIDLNGPTMAEDSRIRPLTDGTLRYDSPSISRSGDWLTFSLITPSGGNIYRMTLDGGLTEQLTFLPGFNQYASISPDARKIGFLARQHEDTQLWVVDVSGRGAHKVDTQRTPEFSQTHWSPDGRLIYRTVDGRNFHLVNLNDGKEEPLLPDIAFGWPYAPRFSEQSDFVAVAWNRPLPESGARGLGIWLVNRKEGTQNLLYPGPVVPIGWSLGDSVIYAHADEGREVFTIQSKTGQRKDVAKFPSGAIESCDMSRDGQLIVCSLSESKSDVWIVENFDSEVSIRKP